MIQQRPTVFQTYYDTKLRAKRQRPIRQYAKLKLDGQTFKLPKRKGRVASLIDRVFGRAA